MKHTFYIENIYTENRRNDLGDYKITRVLFSDIIETDGERTSANDPSDIEPTDADTTGKLVS